MHVVVREWHISWKGFLLLGHAKIINYLRAQSFFLYWCNNRPQGNPIGIYVRWNSFF